jgi:hypothetical protein
MARRRLDRGTRTIVATAGVVVGLAVGIVVVAIVNAGGDGGGGEPAPYQPFFVGTSDRIEKRIKADGPECYQDPREGLGSFCLDLDGNEFIALHVVPPGGTTECLVQWDRKERRYEDCRGGDQREDQRVRRRAHADAAIHRGGVSVAHGRPNARSRASRRPCREPPHGRRRGPSPRCRCHRWRAPSTVRLSRIRA